MLVPAQRAWQVVNHTYAFSTGLGSLEVVISGQTLAGLFSCRLGLVGALLAFARPIVTLSFLVTTPEAWVPSLGVAQHGFPFSAGPGRLVLKDVALLAGAWLVIVDTARALLLEDRRVEMATASECAMASLRAWSAISDLSRALHLQWSALLAMIVIVRCRDAGG